MKTILLAAVLLTPLLALSEQTGAFSTSIQYKSMSREVAVYVPEGLDASKKATLLLGLHGFNQSPSEMAQVLKPIADQQQAIVVCPSGNGNRHDDEYPAIRNGQNVTEEIGLVHVTLDSALQWFSVDPKKVYITGFSYGGREALYTGLEFYYKFAGIIALSPAIQSAADVRNQLPIPKPQPFQFYHAENIPICLCGGTEDAGFYQSIQAFANRLDTTPGKDTLITRPVGHTTQYPKFVDDFAACMDFVKRHAVGRSLGNTSTIPLDISLYPNPGSAALHLATQQGFEGDVQLCNANGKVVYQIGIQGNKEVIINTQSLTRGLYFIKLQHTSGWQHHAIWAKL